MRMNYRKKEKVIKAFANHRRLQILELLKKIPDLSVDQIAQNLNVNFVTISDHLRKLSDAGLVKKNSRGNFVINSLSSRGRFVLKFCAKL